MKVIICKFSRKSDVARRVRDIVSRQEKSSGRWPRVLCVSEPVRKTLEAAGIPCEISDDFRQHFGADDEAAWETVYRTSDELHSSAGNDPRLTCSGVNFLTLEYHVIKYVYAAKLARLCGGVSGQDEALVLVLTEPYGSWLADLNTENIRTVRFETGIKSVRPVKICYDVLLEGYFSFAYARDYLRKLAHPSRPVSAGRRDRSQPRVLFVVSDRLYARPALAIAAECLRKGLVPYIATDDLSLLPLLRRHQFHYWLTPPIALSLACSPGQAIEIPLLASRLRRHIVGCASTVARDGNATGEALAGHLLRKTLLEELPGLCREAVSTIAFCRKLFEKTSPDVVCVMDQFNFFQQIAWAVAKGKYNIPVLACSAGWETATAHASMRRLHADTAAVAGPKIKDLYVESGLAPERVVPTGLAHFDQLFHRDLEQDNQALRANGIDPHKKIILFATEGLEMGESVRALTGVIEAVLKMEDFQLVVKVHPREDAGPFQATADRYRDPRIHVLKDIDLYALLSRCELAVVKFSTVGLEAMMIGKPVVVINLGGLQLPVPYAEEGAAVGVYRYEDIEPAILKALYDEETRARLRTGSDRFVRQWAGEPDGRASLRIVNLMKEMIAQGTQKNARGNA